MDKLERMWKTTVVPSCKGLPWDHVSFEILAFNIPKASQKCYRLKQLAGYVLMLKQVVHAATAKVVTVTASIRELVSHQVR
jgi:phosphoserine phosphatase